MVAVVTGGGTGIGFAIAQRMRTEGHDVVITGRRPGPLHAAAEKIGATPVLCDGAEPADLRRLVDEIGDRTVDALINNAGGNRGYDRTDADGLVELKAAWIDNLQANLLTAVLTTSALEHKLGFGSSVVNLSSIAAARGNGSYGAAKAAVNAWTVDLARRLGKRGITVNAIAPGYISDTEFFRDTMTEERRTMLQAQTMNDRIGIPDDIAGIAHFLTTEQARHITGQTLHVNGGAHAGH